MIRSLVLFCLIGTIHSSVFSSISLNTLAQRNETTDTSLLVVNQSYTKQLITKISIYDQPFNLVLSTADEISWIASSDVQCYFSDNGSLALPSARFRNFDPVQPCRFPHNITLSSEKLGSNCSFSHHTNGGIIEGTGYYAERAELSVAVKKVFLHSLCIAFHITAHGRDLTDPTWDGYLALGGTPMFNRPPSLVNYMISNHVWQSPEFSIAFPPLQDRKHIHEGGLLSFGAPVSLESFVHGEWTKVKTGFKYEIPIGSFMVGTQENLFAVPAQPNTTMLLSSSLTFSIVPNYAWLFFVGSVPGTLMNISNCSYKPGDKCFDEESNTLILPCNVNIRNFGFVIAGREFSIPGKLLLESYHSKTLTYPGANNSNVVQWCHIADLRPARNEEDFILGSNFLSGLVTRFEFDYQNKGEVDISFATLTAKYHDTVE